MKLFEKTIGSRTIYRGKIVNLRVDEVQLPNGKKTDREVVEHGGAVAIVPVNDRNEVLMVRQYRYPAGKELLEIPAGKLEQGEDPSACAVRELEEETGIRAGELKLLFKFYSTPGFTNEILYLYLARGLTYTGSHPDEDEFIQLIHVDLEDALKMVDRGDIRDAKSIIGLLAAKRYLAASS